ncbi:MAG: signal peptidase I [Candidatus Woesearchaeota archaeon]
MVKKEKKKDDVKKILDFIKNKTKRVYQIIFHEDTALSWILNLVLAFILVRFLIYPGLSLILGTNFPVVTVITGSMVQEGSFNNWWNSPINEDITQGEFYERYNISINKFKEFPFNRGFNIGDLIILRGKNPEEIEIGDALVFEASLSKPIIHRVIDKWKEDGKVYFTTKGDNNNGIISGNDINEEKISSDRVIAVGFLRIPYIGWVKLGVVNFTQCLIKGEIGITC